MDLARLIPSWSLGLRTSQSAAIGLNVDMRYEAKYLKRLSSAAGFVPGGIVLTVRGIIR